MSSDISDHEDELGPEFRTFAFTHRTRSPEMKYSPAGAAIGAARRFVECKGESLFCQPVYTEDERRNEGRLVVGIQTRRHEPST